MHARILSLSMLVAAVVAGCGPLPAGDAPASSSARSETGGRRPARSPSVEPPLESSLPMTDDYAAALVEAAREQKPLLLFFTAEWCSFSRQLYADVLRRPEVCELAARFVCVRIDVDRRPDLCEQYRVRAYPTVISASPQGTAWQRLTGAQSAETLVSGLTAALATMADRRANADAVQR